jgi:hypothetical protein
MIWVDRAKIECQLASRNWFGTLTFKPELQTRALMAARLRAAKSAVDFDTMGFSDKFNYQHRELSPLVTDWLKRVRKQADTRFRYLVAAEYHKSGNPHYHILLHELVGHDPVRKAVLQDQWKQNGFSQWKLVVDDEESPRAAHYVCKYLAKTSAARVRASRWYGHPWDEFKERPQDTETPVSRDQFDPNQPPF